MHGGRRVSEAVVLGFGHQKKKPRMQRATMPMKT
jgi:hypothetical protein